MWESVGGGGGGDGNSSSSSGNGGHSVPSHVWESDGGGGGSARGDGGVSSSWTSPTRGKNYGSINEGRKETLGGGGGGAGGHGAGGGGGSGALHRRGRDCKMVDMEASIVSDDENEGVEYKERERERTWEREVAILKTSAANEARSMSCL
jgi:hypothetical protein